MEGGLYGAIGECGVRAARVSKEIDAGNRYAHEGN